jgi:hypothetical protein
MNFNCWFLTFRGSSKLILLTSWTGIAASLFPGGTTCHYSFGLPFPYEKGNTSKLSADSPKGKQLINAKVIVIDEVSNINWFLLDELNRLLIDLTGCGQFFGNKTIILTGDFRQTLPITKKGN